MTGAEFRHWRMSRRWTQPITAEALGVSLRTIVSLENRETIPWLYVLAVQGVNVSKDVYPIRSRKPGGGRKRIKVGVVDCSTWEERISNAPA